MAEQYARRPISELDVNHWQRSTPSYVHLPPDYPLLTSSGRTPLARALLNDVWVSVTTGSEDYSFKVSVFFCIGWWWGVVWGGDSVFRGGVL